MNEQKQKTLLVISQTYVPDPASVGQHMADVAAEMARRGHRVLVYTARRGYDDASVEYPARETRDGVEIRRLRFSSFGKKSILTRILGTATFLTQALFVCLFTPRLEGIFFSTSPPMAGLAASIARIFRRVPIAYWAMDLNPDQLIAMKKIKPRGPVAFILERVNRFILWNSDLVIALDRFMEDRLRSRASLDGRLLVMPPWPHETADDPVDHERNPFREQHALRDRFVIMYSGNHSPANPLATLLRAALQFRDDDSIRFLFVGGGIGKKEVEAFIRDHGLTNALSLPYQPLSELRYSLSAADVHVVSLGDGMVGIIHPCKIYGAMAVARPILFFGPRPSHISDLLDQHQFGLHVPHGDVEAAVNAIRDLRRRPRQDLAEMGRTAQRILLANLSKPVLSARLCDRFEQLLARP